MRPLRHSKLFAALAIVLLLVASTRAARANIGAPWSGGELAGEPAGLAGAAITHEELVIDMRALAEARGLVRVRATYEIENRAGDKHLDLLFASGAADPKNVTVTLDDEPIATNLDKEVAIPPSWRAPTTTPGLGDSRDLSFGRELEETAPVAFHLDLPPGHHRLTVAYSADAMLQHVSTYEVTGSIARS